eukprot:COSAG01_NODE_657_length_14457_cov_99.379649_12_plen_119_part_00
MAPYLTTFAPAILFLLFRPRRRCFPAVNSAPRFSDKKNCPDLVVEAVIRVVVAVTITAAVSVGARACVTHPDDDPTIAVTVTVPIPVLVTATIVVTSTVTHTAADTCATVSRPRSPSL